jgi:integrase
MAEFDSPAAVWEIPAGRMVTILKELRKLRGQGRFLFPSARSVSRCMSENTLNAAWRRMGFKNEDMTSHGFRVSASSMLNESGLWNADAIERLLAHVDGDAVRRASARAVQQVQNKFPKKQPFARRAAPWPHLH